jgi:hypothetical protein
MFYLSLLICQKIGKKNLFSPKITRIIKEMPGLVGSGTPIQRIMVRKLFLKNVLSFFANMPKK